MADFNYLYCIFLVDGTNSDNKESIARLTRENEALQSRLNQLHRQLGNQQGTKPTTSSGAIEKSPSDAARTANVKPMAGMLIQI